MYIPGPRDRRIPAGHRLTNNENTGQGESKVKTLRTKIESENTMGREDYDMMYALKGSEGSDIVGDGIP